MTHRWRFAACAAALVGILTGCGAESDGSAQPGEIGASCADDADCMDGTMCIAEVPGGFCTQECTRDCPGESLCVQVDHPAGGRISVCSPICATDTDCRPEYACVSVGRESVCSL